MPNKKTGAPFVHERIRAVASAEKPVRQIAEEAGIPLKIARVLISRHALPFKRTYEKSRPEYLDIVIEKIVAAARKDKTVRIVAHEVDESVHLVRSIMNSRNLPRLRRCDVDAAYTKLYCRVHDIPIDD